MGLHGKTVSFENGWRFEQSSDASSPELLKIVKDILKASTLPDGLTVMKSSPSSRVYKFNCGGRDYIFKEFLPRSVFEPVKALIRGARAEKALKGGEVLERKNFLAPQAVLWGVKSKCGMPSRNFLVTAFVPGFCGLNTFLRDRFDFIPPKERFHIKRRIASAFGRTVGRLHSEGIIHGDLRLDNIMVPAEPGVGELRFYFIDNERNRVFKKAPLRLVIKNLVQVNMIVFPCVTSRDRVRFFLAYLTEFPAIRRVRRGVSRKVMMLTRRRLKAKHGIEI